MTESVRDLVFDYHRRTRAAGTIAYGDPAISTLSAASVGAIPVISEDAHVRPLEIIV